MQFDGHVIEFAMFDETRAHGGRRLEGHHGRVRVEKLGRDGMQAEICADHPQDSTGLAERRPDGFKHFGLIETFLNDVMVNTVPRREKKLAAVASHRAELAAARDGLEPSIEPDKSAPAFPTKSHEKPVAPGRRLARGGNK